MCCYHAYVVASLSTPISIDCCYNAHMSDSQSLSVVDEDQFTMLENQVLDLLAEGKTLEQIKTLTGLDSKAQWRMERKKPAYAEAVARARAQGGVVLGEVVLTIHEKYDDVQQARLVSDNLKWFLGKRHAAMYGDKLQVDHQVTVNIGEALANARARIARPSCDPAITVDAEYVDVSRAYNPRATDSTSEAPKPVVPDIFS